MTRLTDADELIDVLNSQDLADWLSEQEEYTPASIVEHALETLPTIDAVPVRHGKWLAREVVDDRKDAKIQQWQQARCSCCNKWHTTPYMYYFENYDYCPHCGARMDAERKEE